MFSNVLTCHLLLWCMALKGRESHIHNLLSQSQNWTYHCVTVASHFQPLPWPHSGRPVELKSVGWVHQIAATAVSASVYLSKVWACHPASQAAIARPPPLPYQDNELHLSPLYELTLRTFSAAKRGPCANDGQRECDTGPSCGARAAGKKKKKKNILRFSSSTII